jgi:hypothetical protein
MNIGAGSSGVAFGMAFKTRGLASELVFDSPLASQNVSRLEALQARGEELEATYGGQLEWDVVPGRKAARVGDYLPGADVELEDEWDQYVTWLLDRQTRLREALRVIGGVPEPAPKPAPSP